MSRAARGRSHPGPTGWPSTTPCTDCAAPCYWTTTRNGRPMLVAADVSAHGNVMVTLVAGNLHAAVLGPRQTTLYREHHGLRLAHAVDCPGPRGATARNRSRPHELPTRAYPIRAR